MAELYLISPEKFELNQFASSLDEVLKVGGVAAFQLRVKDCSITEVQKMTKRLLPICHEYGVPFIINDYVAILRDFAVDGIHLGEADSPVKAVRKEFGEDLIIGASCYNSKHLAMTAGESGASYVAFGAFYPTQTKITNQAADIEILKWCGSYINLSCCAIGGINHQNVSDFKGSNVDFICAISAIWQNPAGPVKAVSSLVNLVAEI